jgi:hypothetical protein
MRTELSTVLRSPVLEERTPQARVESELRLLAEFAAAHPQLLSAVATALLNPSPEVGEVRITIGGALHDRIEAALGPKTEAETVFAVELLCTARSSWRASGTSTPSTWPTHLWCSSHSQGTEPSATS